MVSFQWKCTNKIYIPDIQVSTRDNIISDNSNNSPNTDFEENLGIPPIDKTENPTEVRFYLHDTSNGTTSLKLIGLLNQEWQALHFEDTLDSKSLKCEKLDVTEGQIRATIRVLFNYGLAYLPNQSDLITKIEGFHEKLDLVKSMDINPNDHSSYTMEFNIKGKYRVIQFSNPDFYSKVFPDVKEFNQYSAIVETFRVMIPSQ